MTALIIYRFWCRKRWRGLSALRIVADKLLQNKEAGACNRPLWMMRGISPLPTHIKFWNIRKIHKSGTCIKLYFNVSSGDYPSPCPDDLNTAEVLYSLAVNGFNHQHISQSQIGTRHYETNYTYTATPSSVGFESEMNRTQNGYRLKGGSALAWSPFTV